MLSRSIMAHHLKVTFTQSLGTIMLRKLTMAHRKAICSQELSIKLSITLLLQSIINKKSNQNNKSFNHFITRQMKNLDKLLKQNKKNSTLSKNPCKQLHDKIMGKSGPIAIRPLMSKATREDPSSFI
jgi:hypothetical protein